MSEQPETLAAILAEMRTVGNAASDMTIVPSDWLGDWADRIEAAAERERVSAPGNAAAMRDALEQALAYCESDQKSGIAYSDNDVLVPMLRAALSAQARNCDRFATAEEARAAFEAEHSRGIVRNLYTATFGWLFAPAEGGDHA